jgi:RNA polymerase sigma-70 factor (ECF subfamily)
MSWSVRDRPHAEPAEAALAARFDALVRSEYARLAEYAYVLTANRADAEEIVQDVLFGVWRHRDHFDFERPVPYLVRAVRNRSLSRRKLLARRASRMLAGVHAAHDQAVAASDDSLERDELLRDLDAAVASLPARSREIFLLHRVNGLSYAEIADTLGIARKTVENLMGRTLQRLRKSLRSHIAPSIIASLVTRFLTG